MELSLAWRKGLAKKASQKNQRQINVSGKLGEKGLLNQRSYRLAAASGKPKSTMKICVDLY